MTAPRQTPDWQGGVIMFSTCPLVRLSVRPSVCYKLVNQCSVVEFSLLIVALNRLTPHDDSSVLWYICNGEDLINITKAETSARDRRICTVYRSSGGGRVLTSKMSPRRLYTGVKSPRGGFL